MNQPKKRQSGVVWWLLLGATLGAPVGVFLAYARIVVWLPALASAALFLLFKWLRFGPTHFKGAQHQTHQITLDQLDAVLRERRSR